MTTASALEQVPVLSLARLSAEDFADAIGRSFREFGFAMVTDHGMDADLVSRGWALSKAFFALPEAAKRAYLVPGGAGQRGYTAFGTEIAKGASENDLKEFWHVGRTLPPGSPLEADMPPNIWPKEIDGFRETFETLFATFDATGARILSGVARHLGLAPDWFDSRIENGNSILRLLHYPPVSAQAPGIRAGAHEDINLITARRAGHQCRRHAPAPDQPRAALDQSPRRQSAAGAPPVCAICHALLPALAAGRDDRGTAAMRDQRQSAARAADQRA
mgnify:CR=1 FL=1